VNRTDEEKKNLRVMDVAALFAAAKSAPHSSGGVDALFAAAKGGEGGSGNPGETLRKAAQTGDLALLQEVIESHKTLNLDERGGWDGMTALHWAAQKGHMECARCLVTAGANVNGKDSNHFTPLMVAVTTNRHAMVKELMNLGANVELEMRGQRVDWTAHAIDDDMLSILIASSSGADASSKDTGTTSAAEGANLSGSKQALKKRHEQGSPPSSRTRAAKRKDSGRGAV
jgi:hypothetical protein